MPSPLNPLARRAATLRKTLDKILSKPKPEPIHQLRSTLRRILAELSILPDSPETTHFTHLAKPLLKSAGKVRDLDIHLDLLAKLPHTLQPEIDSLARHVQKKRRHRATTFQKRIEKHRKELLAAFSSLPSTPLAAAPTARKAARNTFNQALATLDPSEPDQLHELRKAARNARYLAESAPNSPTSDAAHYRHIQQTLGAWHDYLTLAQTAHRHLPDSSPLILAIERLRDRHHRAALKSLAAPAATGRPQPAPPSHPAGQRSAELPGPTANIFYKR